MLAWARFSQLRQSFLKDSGVYITGMRMGPWEDAVPCYLHLSLAPEPDGGQRERENISWSQSSKAWWETIAGVMAATMSGFASVKFPKATKHSNSLKHRREKMLFVLHTISSMFKVSGINRARFDPCEPTVINSRYQLKHTRTWILQGSRNWPLTLRHRCTPWRGLKLRINQR